MPVTPVVNRSFSVGYRPYIILAVICLVIGVGALTWMKTINYPRAALIADGAAAQFREGKITQSRASLDQAINLAPDVSTYYRRRDELISLFSGGGLAAYDETCGFQGPGVGYEACRAEEDYFQNRAWVDQRPFSFRSRFALANDAFNLARLRSDANRLVEARRLFQGVADMVPNSYGRLNLLGEVELKTGHPGAALKPLQRAIAITGDSRYSTDSMVLLGEAYRALGQPRRAVDNLPDEVIDRYPNRSESYNIRGASYFELGQFFWAINDLSTAIRTDPKRTVAYNDRGQAFAKIGQFELAIADFDRAIGLHSQFGSAYYNRALAHVLQGQDAAAEQDAAYAVALGFNSVQVKEAIDGLRGQGPDQLHQGRGATPAEPVRGVENPRLLAIDLDLEKRYLGLAVTDPSGRIALPAGHIWGTAFVENDVRLLLAEAGDLGVGGLVMGLPYGLDGASNSRVNEALAYIEALKNQTTLPIYSVNARFPSMEARSVPGEAGGQPSQRRATINETIATLILKRFLDQHQNRPGDPLKGG